jgi:translation initiation factor 1
VTKARNPFAALEALRAQLPRGPEPAPAATPAPPPPRGTVRAVVRMERKGRGGKEVTIVALARGDKLALPPEELERWCRELKQALGCGGTIEGELIVLQGDLRPRIGAVLEARGVKAPPGAHKSARG